MYYICNTLLDRWHPEMVQIKSFVEGFMSVIFAFLI